MAWQRSRQHAAPRLAVLAGLAMGVLLGAAETQSKPTDSAAGVPIRGEIFPVCFQNGVYRIYATQKDGQRSSTARSYLEPVRHRPNLTVLTGAEVDRVIVADGRATGVELRLKGEKRTIKAGREVLICAGTLLFTDFVVMSGYTGLAAKVLTLLREPRHVRWVNRGFGGMFVAAGLALATFRRA